jgi:hypothetical protein
MWQACIPLCARQVETTLSPTQFAKSKRNSGIAIDRVVSIQKGPGNTLLEPSSSEIFDYG